MHQLLEHAAASIAAICIAAASFGTLITIPAPQVASLSAPILA